MPQATLELRERTASSPGPAAVGRPSLLCIPGAFHGADCWDEHWLPWFADRGVPARALSLRGHGRSGGRERLADAGLDDYCDDVETILDGLDGPVVLVGHSMGGVVAERVFARRPDVAGLVLVACSPLRISPRVALRLLARQPRAVIHGLIGRNPEAAKPAFLEFFFSDALPEADRRRHAESLGGESQRAIDAVFSRDAIGREAGDDRPVLVIAGRGDWSIPRASHERLADAWQASLVWCDGAHDLMLDVSWRESARALLDWLDAEAFAQPFTQP